MQVELFPETAATVDRSLGYGGIRSFVVPADAPGFTVVKANEEKLGMRAMCTSSWEGTGQIRRSTISRSLMGSGAAAG